MARIALVVLDTLRKDAFDDHFDWLPGVRFENAWSTSNWTAPAHASLFTGRYPSEVGVGSGEFNLTCDDQVLAEQLREAGYRTRAFSANSIVSREYGFGRGFDEFRGTWSDVPFNRSIPDFGQFTREEYGVTRHLRAGLECLWPEYDTATSLKYGVEQQLRQFGFEFGPDDDGATVAMDMVSEMHVEDDEFLFLNLMEAHGPYTAPEEYRTVEYDGDLPNGLEMALDDETYDSDVIKQTYHDCVRYLSDVYRDVFAELESKFDHVITLADHGELLGEHGYWKHTFGLFPETTHVPLVVSSGEDAIEHREQVVNHLDVYATVRALAGLDLENVRGRDLTGAFEDRPSVLEYHGISLPRTRDRLREAFSSAVVDAHDSPLHGLALPPSYYRYETRDGFEERGHANRDDLGRLFSELTDELPNLKANDGHVVGEDSQVVDRLADLGYV